MAKKSGSGTDEIITYLTFLAALAGALFLLNAIAVNRYHSKKYNVSEADIRVTDSGNILRFRNDILKIGLIIILLLPVCLLGEVYLLDVARLRARAAFPAASHTILNIVFDMLLLGAGGLSIAAVFLACLGISAHIGTAQIGMLVFPEKGIFVIPTDPARNTFTENVFKFKWLKDRFSMEELPIAELDKITRQSGTNAYVHGRFGTRRIEWRNKQKRDECIATLERARGRRLSSPDFAQ